MTATSPSSWPSGRDRHRPVVPPAPAPLGWASVGDEEHDLVIVSVGRAPSPSLELAGGAGFVVDGCAGDRASVADGAQPRLNPIAW